MIFILFPLTPKSTPMNDNELNNMLSDFFSKANLAPGKSSITLEPANSTTPDYQSVAFVFAAQTFICEVKILIDESHDNKTEFVLGRTV